MRQAAIQLSRQLARRLGVSLLLLVLLSLVAFVGVDLLPGDPVTAHLGATATPERVEQARERLGLDRSVVDRYLEWAGGLLSGDLGESATGRRVGDMLSDRVGNSVLLTGLVVLLLVPLSLLLGVLAAGRSGRAGRTIDRTVSTGALLLVSVPEFVVASALVVLFAVLLPVLPAVSLIPADATPLDHPEMLVLPVLSLLLVGLAYAVRVIRGTAVATMGSPVVESLRLNGVRDATILRRAVVPAVLPAAVQVWAVTAVGLLGGAVLVERVYGYPGLGEVLVSAVRIGDLPVVQALVLILGAVTLVALVLADFAAALLTPRRRTEFAL